jgi:hypothetical protein
LITTNNHHHHFHHHHRQHLNHPQQTTAQNTDTRTVYHIHHHHYCLRLPPPPHLLHSSTNQLLPTCQIGAARFKGAFPPTLFDPSLHRDSANGGIFVRAKGDGAPAVTPGFKVVVLAQQRWQDYEKELRQCFGQFWGSLSAIRIVDNSPQ